jgi:hypothetical protein
MTLEEPPPHSFLILITEAPQRLPETIVSRCQLLHFGELGSQEISEILANLLPGSSGLAEELAAQLPGSTAQLGLESFVDPRTLAISNPKQFEDYCKKRLEEGRRLGQRLKRALGGSGGASGLLSLASELASEKDGLPLIWQLFRNHARDRLRASDSGNAEARAELLLAVLQSEQLSRERTLNPQLQLSSLLLRAGKANSLH